jgi:hypothetical protein
MVYCGIEPQPALTPYAESSNGGYEPELESRLKTLFARMGVTTPTEAVAAAMRRGLLAA